MAERTAHRHLPGTLNAVHNLPLGFVREEMEQDARTLRAILNKMRPLQSFSADDARLLAATLRDQAEVFAAFAERLEREALNG